VGQILNPYPYPLQGRHSLPPQSFTRIPNGFPYGPLAFAGENTGLTRST